MKLFTFLLLVSLNGFASTQCELSIVDDKFFVLNSGNGEQVSDYHYNLNSLSKELINLKSEGKCLKFTNHTCSIKIHEDKPSIYSEAFDANKMRISKPRFSTVHLVDDFKLLKKMGVCESLPSYNCKVNALKNDITAVYTEKNERISSFELSRFYTYADLQKYKRAGICK